MLTYTDKELKTLLKLKFPRFSLAGTEAVKSMFNIFLNSLNEKIASIDTSNLSGTNYVMVYGLGTPTENAAELQTAYNAYSQRVSQFTVYDFIASEDYSILNYQVITNIDTTTGAKTYYQLTNGDQSGINGDSINPQDGNITLITDPEYAKDYMNIIIAPGDYKFGSQKFNLNVKNINIISLTGNPDVKINGLNINTENVYIKGIDSSSVNNAFAINIVNSKPIIFEKCKGGSGAFSTNGKNLLIKCIDCIAGDNSYNSNQANISVGSSFIRCIGGANSFGNSVNKVEGTFTDCVAGGNSFASYLASGSGENYGVFTNCISTGGNSFGFDAIDYGVYNNCKGGDYCFGCTDGEYASQAKGTYNNCVAGPTSFGYGASTITGKFYYCVGGAGSLATNGHYCVMG